MRQMDPIRFPFRNWKLVIRNLRSFTLIELLVVLAIVAILSVVVIMTLNPSELLKQARDSNRLSDLSTLNTALSAYSADVNGGFMGTSTVVYVSIPDTSPTCDNLGLPTSTGAGFTYHCATAENLKRADGQGWIPVNFSNISFGSPLSSLPVDPTNTTSSGNYYTYVSGGSFILTALPESQKQKTALSSNPNISNYPGVIAVGNNLSLSPLYNPSGLVGYWNLDGDAIDSSGYGNNGTWNGTSTERYAAGKVGTYAGYFNGSGDYLNCGNGASLSLTGPLTESAWVNFSMFKNYGYVFIKSAGGSTGVNYRLMTEIDKFNGMIADGTTTNAIPATYASGGVTLGNWALLTFTADGSTLKIYINGSLKYSGGQTITPAENSSSMFIGASSGGVSSLGGLIDEARLYNRALSQAEIIALYNAAR